MRKVTEARDDSEKGQDMVMGYISGRGADLLAAFLGGAPWYSPDPATPACGAVHYVPPEASDDGTERMYCCDRAASSCTPSTKHRQVTDAEEPTVYMWSYDATETD